MAKLYTQANERVTVGGKEKSLLPSEGAEMNEVPFS